MKRIGLVITVVLLALYSSRLPVKTAAADESGTDIVIAQVQPGANTR